VRATFAALDRIAAHGPAYKCDFGVIPDFRAGLHCGPVAVGELGSLRKEIALIGDTMNTAARIQEACRNTDNRMLASADLLERLAALPPRVARRRLGNCRCAARSTRSSLMCLRRRGYRRLCSPADWRRHQPPALQPPHARGLAAALSLLAAARRPATPSLPASTQSFGRSQRGAPAAAPGRGLLNVACDPTRPELFGPLPASALHALPAWSDAGGSASVIRRGADSPRFDRGAAEPEPPKSRSPPRGRAATYSEPLNWCDLTVAPSSTPPSRCKHR
jgi:hypothetical protein